MERSAYASKRQALYYIRLCIMCIGAAFLNCV
jgi:hypothetical protein